MTPLEKLPVEVQIKRIFKDDYKIALAISQAENGRRTCDRVHVNKDGSKDIGVFQINEKWHGHRGDLDSCTENIRIAHQIFTEQGNWSAWVTYNTGAYKKFLIQ